jgi:MprA protease rhombosortase-interaction domain-containing protein
MGSGGIGFVFNPIAVIVVLLAMAGLVWFCLRR